MNARPILGTCVATCVFVCVLWQIDSIEEDSATKAAAAAVAEGNSEGNDLSPDLALIADKMTQSCKKQALQSFSSSLQHGAWEDEEPTSVKKTDGGLIDNEEVQTLLCEAETMSRTSYRPSMECSYL